MENKQRQRFCGMLGFARRAGKVTIGTDAVCTAMAKGNAKLVIIASGISPSTKKKLTVKSEFYNIPAIEADMDTESLGSLLGKEYTPAAVAVTDKGFAEELLKVSAHTLSRKEVSGITETGDLNGSD